MADYQLGIDGSAAESGSQKIVKSFDSILAAANRMEGGVSAAARKASASFNALAATRGVSPKVVAAIRELSSVMSNFKGPSSASVTNALNLLNGLKAVGSLRISGGGVAGLLGSLSGYKGPSGSSATNTTKLLQSLGKFSGLGGGLRGVLPLLNTLTAFKGPSSAAARNVSSLLGALQNFKAPAGLAGVARAFEALAASANKASAAIGRIKTLSSGSSTITVNTRQASSGILQLSKDHGVLHSAIFKTQTLYRSLGGIFAGRAIINASGAIVQIKAQLEAATGSVEQAAIQFEFLTRYAEKLGLEITSLSKSYGFFLGSVKGTNITMEESRQIFVGFSTAARALQLSTSDVDGVFRALGQILSKGKLQAEELRGQLGDRLPGAFIRFAKALDLTKPGQLDDALKKGAISGDRLKKAILEVARTLELEFALSADKMSLTVSAAFNRLQNSFTFASASLGKNGLNGAIINITDSLRKFLTSDAFNAGISLLGNLFKILGENIEVVASGAIAYAILSFTRFAAVTLTTTAVVKSLQVAFAGLAVSERVLGLSRLPGYASDTTRAFRLLWAVIIANPFVALAAVITSVVIALALFNKKGQEAKQTLDAFAGSTANADNLVRNYIATIYDSGAALDSHTQKLRTDTLEKIRNARAGLSTADPGYITGQAFTLFSKNGRNPIGDIANALGLGGSTKGRDIYTTGGQRLSKEESALFRQSTAKGGTGVVGIGNEKDFIRNETLIRRIGALVETDKAFNVENPLTERLRQLKVQNELIIQEGDTPGNKLGFNPREVQKRVFGDVNKEANAVGLSGDPMEKAKREKKGPKGPSDAGNVQDIRRAEEALRDLNREITASDAALTEFSKASPDVIGAQAKAQAVAKVDNFSDSFSTAEAAAAGLSRIAAAFGLIVPPGQDARKVLEEFLETKERVKIESANDADVVKSTNDLRIENAARRESIEAIAKGGQVMEEANTKIEVEARLIGTSIEKQASLRASLTKEITAREALNRALETSNEIRDARSSAKVETDVAALYGKGYKEEELSYYRDLYDYRQKILNDNYSEAEINDKIALRRATLDLADAVREAQKEEEKLRQLASDQADAIVNGFKQGVESGDSFLKTMKNIFKDLKNILLDFVLYNPLREYLRDIFASTGPSNSKAGGITTFGGNLTDAANRSQGGLGSGLSLLGSLAGAGGERSSNPPMSAVQLSNSPGAQAIGSAVGDEFQIVVTKSLIPILDKVAPIGVNGPKQNALSSITSSFKSFGSGFKDIKSVFAKGGDLTKTLGPAVKAIGTAVAAFSAAKGIAKALGAGRTGSNVAGGAAAGFSLGGPIGAAIGAVAGLAFSFLTKKKISSAFSSVSVGANGIAAGTSGTYGNGKIANADKAGKGGSALFNQFAIEFDARLKAGDYGTFGSRKFKGDKEKSAFYSATGQIKKGKPVGVEGVDYVKGTDSEVQAFALRSQIKSGQIQGLSKTLQTVGTNSTAKTLEELQQDFAVGKSYDEFIRASFAVAETANQVRELTLNTEKLKKQAALLGLAEDKISDARDRIIKKMRKDFNFTVSQGILSITDPRLEAFNALEKEYRDTVENGLAVGGDLLAVEKLFGLKRVEIAKQVAEEQANVYKDLLTSLTASSSSPLNADSVLRNAQDNYRGLQTKIRSGDLTDLDKLGTYTENYLAAAREVNASGSGYFDIFNEVTNFLSQMSAVASTSSTTGGSELPALPNLDVIVAEITARNQELVDVNNNIGVAIVETAATNVTELQNLGITLEAIKAILANKGGIATPGNIMYDGNFLNLNLSNFSTGYL